MKSGEPFCIQWRVIGHRNSAQVAYWLEEFEVFIHQHDDEECWRLYATQEWIDEHPWEETHICEEYARSYVDGTIVDPDNLTDHERIERITE
jgi:hypothetical protein